MTACLTLPIDARWRALQTSCCVVARRKLEVNDSLLIRLNAALLQMDAKNAHAVLSALALPSARDLY